MRKKTKRNKVALVRTVSWFLEAILAGLFFYAYLTLTDLIQSFGVRLAVMILAFPFIASTWLGICILIALIRERWILDD